MPGNFILPEPTNQGSAGNLRVLRATGRSKTILPLVFISTRKKLNPFRVIAMVLYDGLDVEQLQ